VVYAQQFILRSSWFNFVP